VTERTWILTGSPENFDATRARGFTVIGLKERNRARALQIAPGDRFVLYLTKIKRFAGAIRITGELFESREHIWPGKPGKVDPYPWRFETEPEVILEEDGWIQAEDLADELEHVAKWPREHWTLAFQGQIRPVSGHDAVVLLERLGAAVGHGVS
jgi:hypothetical protein